jgi:KaiC/GvpD/RAD55 family RecA-like ATPase
MAEANERHQTLNEGREGLAREEAVTQLTKKLGVTNEQAEKLYKAGLRTPESARMASEESLKGLGFTAEEVKAIISGTPSATTSPDLMLEKWLENRAKSSRKKDRHNRVKPAASPDAGDVLKKWLAGDDAALDTWLKPKEAHHEAPTAPIEPMAPLVEPTPTPTEPVSKPEEISPPPVVLPPPEAPVEPIKPETEVKGEEKAPTTPETVVVPEIPVETAPTGPAPKEPTAPGERVSKPPVESAGTVEEQRAEEAMLSWVSEVANRLQGGKVDVSSFLKEGNVFASQLQKERKLRRELEEEVAHVKKGSVAVIKYVRSKEERLREEAVAGKEKEIQDLKAELETAKASAGTVAPAKDGQPQRSDTGQTSMGSLKPMIEALKIREKVLSAKEKELNAKVDELNVRNDEMEKKLSRYATREDELTKWEEGVRLREEELKLQTRKFESDRKAVQDPAVMDKLRHMEDLDADIAKREAEIKARERFLQQKLDELQGKEKEVVDAEVKQADTDLAEELKKERGRTGISRLDDLLFGGLPIGCNILVNGSKHTGKEVMAKFLASEGLKKMIPVLWILTDTDFAEIREEMTTVLPTYKEYERRGLVHYMDLYSMNMGVTKEEPNVTLLSLNQPNALETLSNNVDAITTEFLRSAKYYRLIFESLSTITAYLDTSSTLKFLQPFLGKRRKDKAVCYYLIETGMHEEGDIDTLEHMMDGSIDLKVEQMKTYLAVKGILDEVQSRAWVSYTFTKRLFSMGSFSLDHIR